MASLLHQGRCNQSSSAQTIFLLLAINTPAPASTMPAHASGGMDSFSTNHASSDAAGGTTDGGVG